VQSFVEKECFASVLYIKGNCMGVTAESAQRRNVLLGNPLKTGHAGLFRVRKNMQALPLE
jgi:hypothetical protein